MKTICCILLLVAYTTFTYAQQWKPLGPIGSTTFGNHMAPQSGTGQIHSILFDSDNPQVVYCASPYGGLYKSTNGGKNWSNKEIDTLQQLELAAVSDVAITKRGNEKVMWVAVGHPAARGNEEPYSCGLYQSFDGGATFKPLEAFNKKYGFAYVNKKHISKITAHPSNPDIIYLATSDGLYQTTNGGKKWKLVLREIEFPGVDNASTGIFSVEFSKSNPNKVVYACGADIYKSSKGGKKNSFKSFTHHLNDLLEEPSECLRNININIEVNFNEQGNDVLYAAACLVNDTCRQLNNGNNYLLSYFDGSKWQKKNAPPMSGFVDAIRLRLASVPNQPNIVYAGSGVTSVSTDYGKTWKQATDYNQPGHADIHAIEIIPDTYDMLTGTDGGVFRYNHSSGKVEECNNGLNLAQVFDMGSSPTNPNRLLIGLQDMGAYLWDGKEWSKLPMGGDGYQPQHIDYYNDNNYFSCHNYDVLRNTSGNSSFRLENCNTCSKKYGGCPTAFEQDPTKPGIFYSGIKDVFKSVDSGRTWCQVSEFAKKNVYINPNGHSISAIKVAPSNPQTVYVAFNAFPECCNPLLFRTKSGGTTCRGVCSAPDGMDAWEQIQIPKIETLSGQEGWINSYHSVKTLAVSYQNENIVWIGFNRFDLKDLTFTVHKTTDGGITWQKDDDGLPVYPVTKLVYVNGSNDALFAGTTNGVYYKQGNEKWQLFGTGLPKVYVSDIEINYAVKKVRVSTLGCGVWETDLP